MKGEELNETGRVSRAWRVIELSGAESKVLTVKKRKRLRKEPLDTNVVAVWSLLSHYELS